MAQIEIDGRTFEVDGDGFLTDPSIWNDEVAALIAKSDDINELTEQHWAIIRVIRANFEETGMAPMIRKICKETGLKLKDPHSEKRLRWGQKENPKKRSTLS